MAAARASVGHENAADTQKTRFSIAICFLVTAAAAWATSPFDGVWIADIDAQSGLATDIYLVRDGQYLCASCEPPRAYPADGNPHPIVGAADVTSEAVMIAGPRTIVTHIAGPPRDRTTTMTVSVDDRTATYVSIDHRPGINAALRTEYLARRVAPTPPGAHRVSGSWQGVRYVKVPELVRTMTLLIDGDQLRYSTPLGTSYNAKLGGDYAPVRRASGAAAMVAVRQLGTRQIEQKVTREGKLVEVRNFTLTPDGRSLEIATTDPSSGTTSLSISRRAPERNNGLRKN